jgi:hypothetical protein
MRRARVKFLLRFLWALVKHILDRFRKVSKREYKLRIFTCMSCIHLDKTPKPWEHCNECGCPVREKAKWRSEGCPRDKWYK